MNKINKYPFKFSCIMAVYKVEEYIEEAILSVINQTIGFEENVQLILVDDGSPDNAGAICDNFAKLYPNNITVIHKENGGVSSARNAGLKMATGEFINFIDADDKFSKNAFTSVYRFFKKHKNETDVVCIPMFFFEAKTGPHMLNDKFEKGSRIIDLTNEPNAILLTVNNSFYTHESIINRNFDCNFTLSEDYKFNYELFLERAVIGVVTNAKYMYRKRLSENQSAIQGKLKKKESYTHYFTDLYLGLARLYKSKMGYIPQYLQHALIYDIQWYLREEEISTEILNDTETRDFISTIKDVFQYIDNRVIIEQPQMPIEYKIQALLLKQKQELTVKTTETDVNFFYGDEKISCLSKNFIQLHILEKNNSKITLYGKYICCEPELFHYSIVVVSNGTQYNAVILETLESSTSFGETISYKKRFKVTIPLENKYQDFDIFMQYGDILIPANNMYFWSNFPISDKCKNSYCAIQDSIISYKGGNSFRIQKKTMCLHMIHELLFLFEHITKNFNYSIKVIPIRILYFILNIFKKKKIVLISDRINKAGDNGEALFKYIQSLQQKDIKPYFVLDKNCADYKRLCTVGKVVPCLSIKHRVLHLLSDAIISSHDNPYVQYPFDNRMQTFKDIAFTKPFIFLQHGIIKDDISNWLNKLNKNISGFVCAANPEYNSILNGTYYYSKTELWLTGLPRFDYLEDKKERIITIMPTWRKYLFSKLDNTSGKWILKEDFIYSEYFIFYNSLLNHPKLLKACNDYDFTLQFFPHPNIMSYIDLFTENEQVQFCSLNTQYNNIYAKSSLVVTDYSSAVFDFAYLNKPIIYTQFDLDDFFAGSHVYNKGYFDYERDGFGEVVYDLETTVETIISYIKNDCELKDKYRERIDNFFAFRDKNNCKRVYNKIVDSLFFM